MLLFSQFLVNVHVRIPLSYRQLFTYTQKGRKEEQHRPKGNLNYQRNRRMTRIAKPGYYGQQETHTPKIRHPRVP